MSAFSLHIVSPTEEIFEGNASSLSIMTTSGRITVLPNHTPLVSVVGKGEMIVKTKEGTEHKFESVHGVVDIRPSKTVVLIHNGD
ncbi:MAG: F0F1 ATP synthase subunit epsilon [Candidatus Paceibacterota bacterium]